MSGPSEYVDRRTGELRSDPIHAPLFLEWCHNSRLGWLATNALFCRGPASKLYGWWHRRHFTRRKIRAFADQLDIDVTEAERPLESYGSFAEFIERRIDLGRRPVDGRSDVCISPVDARILAYPTVGLGDRLVIKRTPFDLRGLLDDPALAEAHDGGAVLVHRLYLSDYHHFHFPAAGVPGRPRSIPGRYFAVTPYSRGRLVPFFSENHRMVTAFESERFGPITIVEVGAFTIGSITQTFVPRLRVERAAHKGVFQLGASIVVLIFRAGAITLDEDLVTNTRNGRETYVRLGESVGRARGGAREGG